MIPALIRVPASVVVYGRMYERSASGRWSYQPKNGHKRTEVHRTSRLHHALNALADARSALALIS
jgi:hypothetical protein